MRRLREAQSRRLAASSPPTCAACSSASTRVSSLPRPGSTSPTRATTSGGCWPTTSSRPACPSPPQQDELLADGLGLTNAARRVTCGSGERAAPTSRTPPGGWVRSPGPAPGCVRVRGQTGIRGRVRRAPRPRAAGARAGGAAAVRAAVHLSGQRGGALLREAAVVPGAGRAAGSAAGLTDLS